MQPFNIGHYKIIEILGEGGMGIVYKALDLRLERFVALKVLNSQALNNPQFVERFKREAKNQAKLNHHNIVPVYGFTEENRTLGIVMEYVEGETLERMIERKGRIGVLEALKILKQILNGASYAHNKGFVHRDIKPSNIIINKEGVAKIMDFGISKSLTETRGITRTGTKLGTLLYMSPEQVKAHDPTNQSDIYSIGITFYEMLSGHNPFDLGTDYQIMEAQLKMNPPRLSTMVGNIGHEVDDLIARSLNKSLKKRYQNCEEFVTDVTALIDKLEFVPPVKTKSGSFFKKSITQAKSIESVPPKENKPAKKGRVNFTRPKFFIFAFFFIIILSGLIIFVYDAVSDVLTSGSTVKKDSETVLDGYKLNPSYILKTKWTRLNTNTQNQLNAVFFLDDSTGYACGLNGTLIKTTDGGNNWENQIDTADVLSKVDFYDIYFTSPSNGFLLGEYGTLLSYNPFSHEFIEINTIATGTLFDINFQANKNFGIITGSEGTILVTENGGVSWKKVSSPTQQLLYDAAFVDDQTAFIAGWDGTILSSDNRGESWTLHDKISDNYLRGIYFVNDDLGFTVGGGGEIFRTDDGGDTWETIKSGLISGLYGVYFFNKTHGIILGSRGEVLVTEDSGKTWKVTSSGQYAGLTNLFVTPSNKIYISGQNGVILTSDN